MFHFEVHTALGEVGGISMVVASEQECPLIRG